MEVQQLEILERPMATTMDGGRCPPADDSVFFCIWQLERFVDTNGVGDVSAREESSVGLMHGQASQGARGSPNRLDSEAAEA